MQHKVAKSRTNISQNSEARVSCRVPRKLIRRLKKISRAYGIDVSDVVRMSLKQQLPAYEQELQKAKAA